MKDLIHNKENKEKAQYLRKNATKQENHLWYDFLRAYPIRFRRQVPIDRYIVDFYCASVKIAVELDGSQHYSNAGKEYDIEREKRLEEYGLTILRFSNEEVDREFNGVCTKIHEVVKLRLGYEPYAKPDALG